MRAGRPVLVGTRSVAASEAIAARLAAAGHQRRRAQRRHAEEAEIVARAGRPGCITVATNMAGRGTDIKLAPERDAGRRAARHPHRVPRKSRASTASFSAAAAARATPAATSPSPRSTTKSSPGSSPPPGAPPCAAWPRPMAASCPNASPAGCAPGANPPPNASTPEPAAAPLQMTRIPSGCWHSPGAASEGSRIIYCHIREIGPGTARCWRIVPRVPWRSGPTVYATAYTAAQCHPGHSRREEPR